MQNISGNRFRRLIPALILTSTILAPGQADVRTEIKIPDIPGFKTLKCDFHIHTVFSDGYLWPPIRVLEAWREGLDAIALTDHIEYQPHRDDIPTSHSRPYELALQNAEELNLILIRGAEITRSMPPGHFNAIFLEDIEPLAVDSVLDAIEAAIEQGAFVFWNHPGWRQPGTVPRWYPIHDDLWERGWIHGIEVANDREYYPLAVQWCLGKGAAVLGSSDIHGPTDLYYDFPNGDHRPMTLVFAKKRTPEAIKSALFAGRTAAYFERRLIGPEKFLRPIFEQSVDIVTPAVVLKGKGSALVQVRNTSSIPYHLEARGEGGDLSYPEGITLYPEKTVLLRVRAASPSLSGDKTHQLAYTVTTLVTGPEQGLPVDLAIRVKFVPAED